MAVEQLVYDGVRARGGSISAKRGIGLDKRAALHASRPPQVLALIRQLEPMMDPQGLLNPDKVA